MVDPARVETGLGVLVYGDENLFVDSVLVAGWIVDDEYTVDEIRGRWVGL